MSLPRSCTSSLLHDFSIIYLCVYSNPAIKRIPLHGWMPKTQRRFIKWCATVPSKCNMKEVWWHFRDNIFWKHFLLNKDFFLIFFSLYNLHKPNQIFIRNLKGTFGSRKLHYCQISGKFSVSFCLLCVFFFIICLLFVCLLVFWISFQICFQIFKFLFQISFHNLFSTWNIIGIKEVKENDLYTNKKNQMKIKFDKR